jgi:sialate O-acetylesterase
MKGLVYSFLLIFAIILLLVSCSPKYDLTSQISLPSIFSDNMVLQADKPILIWGKIDPVTQVNANINDNNSYAVSDSNGIFLLELDEMDYG